MNCMSVQSALCKRHIRLWCKRDMFCIPQVCGLYFLTVTCTGAVAARLQLGYSHGDSHSLNKTVLQRSCHSPNVEVWQCHTCLRKFWFSRLIRCSEWWKQFTQETILVSQNYTWLIGSNSMQYAISINFQTNGRTEMRPRKLENYYRWVWKDSGLVLGALNLPTTFSLRH